ncbi:unnamed protein product [Brassicogethes aeneus]|uniref:Uncharacterized protein n=1 Tax=Brassicogethes aeneus TaxID=1431903 RepID=A0A9P0FDU7_BRAAE|nr:unnamed protein product [Brassicogethes aeneus]
MPWHATPLSPITTVAMATILKRIAVIGRGTSRTIFLRWFPSGRWTSEVDSSHSGSDNAYGCVVSDNGTYAPCRQGWLRKCGARCFLFPLVVFPLLQDVNAEEGNNFFLKASKSVPRIGRNTRNKEDFDNFFLKASKSVPRIGRRNQMVTQENSNEEDTDSLGKLLKCTYLKKNTERELINFALDPTWSEIAEKYEYYPEIFNSETLKKLEEELGDDPSIYEWDKSFKQNFIYNSSSNLNLFNMTKSLEYTKSNFDTHSFVKEVMDKKIVFQVVKMKDSTLIYINDKDNLSLTDLSLSVASRFNNTPIGTTLVGSALQGVSQGFAAKLSRKLKKSVFLSCNLEEDRMLIPVVEKELFSEIKNNADKF